MQPENPAPIPPQPPIPPPPVSSPKPADSDLPPSSGDHITESDSDLIEKDEHIVTIVHRHPIGIVGIYASALAGTIAIIAVVFFVAPDFLNNLSGQAYSLFIAGVILVIALLALILFVATYLYRQSRLLVTDKSLVQIIQRGLFIRKISRLSMSNVEDVTADHEGFLATIFNFGTLTIQTAGEEDNFVFNYCPTPDIYAERILDARQAYARSLEEAHAAGRPAP